MKVINAAAHVFTIFAYLTIGSLLIIVSFHILSLDDALLKIQEVYSNPLRSFQTGAIGFLFIILGLTFARTMVKKGRETDALIYQSEMGPIVVSVTAIEDVVKKVMKKFHLIKEWRVKTFIRSKDVEISLRLILWSGGHVPDILTEIQDEIRARVRKLLGPESKLEIACDVQRIEDYEFDAENPESKQIVYR